MISTNLILLIIPTQKMKFSITDFFSRCNQTRSLLWIWSYLVNTYLMEHLIFCAVYFL